jgi:sodium/hydrogen exchanger family protein
VPHDVPLIATMAAGLAFVGGLPAVRLRLPPILGYLLAGVAVGPFTPGYVADAGLAGQLAEIGVMLMMFGVGITSPRATSWPCAPSPCRAPSRRSPPRPRSGPGSPASGAGPGARGWSSD